MKTNYSDLILDLIDHLEGSLNEDLGIPKNRDICSGLMFQASRIVSPVDEKELSTWIMHSGNDLDIDPLELDHPQRADEIEEYKGIVLGVIKHLKTYL